MPYYMIEDFRSGLDSRRMPVLSVPGSLLELTNAHINRGGEIEKRLAFVKQVDLPADTFGLVAIGSVLYTFGSVESVSFPSNAPSNLVYQRLQAPGGQDMVKVLRATAFKNRPYVIAQYDDGAIYHFHDGQLHLEFVEARARTSFEITGGTSGGVQASASFEVTGGINSDTDQITYIRAGTIPVLPSPVRHVGNNATTAQDIADAINAFQGEPNFTAVATGAVVTITAQEPGTLFNGLGLEVIATGSFGVNVIGDFAGGIDNCIAALTVDGVAIIGEPVLHTGDNDETAQLVANAINEYQSAPEYRATAVGNKVNVIIQEPGVANNTLVLTISLNGDVTTTPASTASFAGGVDLVVSPAGSETYLPGEFAKPAKSKMYSTAGPLLHFSEIEDPTDINNTANAGFIDLSTTGENSERLTAIANYNNDLAIFSERSVQVWFVDVDPSGNQLIQVLNNTGAVAPGSVQEIGDSDVLFLSESGIRSLRARDSSNAAFASDVGNPIDTLVLNELIENRLAALDSKAVLEPRDGRYMLALGSRVYVFSFFPASSVSAWSTYEPGFSVTDWAIIGRRLYCRGGDGGLYLLGGRSGADYDRSRVVVTLPYLSGGKPATSKGWRGMDVASEGVWGVFIGADPNAPQAYELVGTIEESTMNKGHFAFQARSTHLSVRLVNEEPGPAKIGALMMHYEDGSQG